MNIRTQIGFKQAYYTINREERNVAAIFYHTLLINNNLNLFLKKLNYKSHVKAEETGIYVEYAFLRDLWNKIIGTTEINANDIKRKLILDFLKPYNKEDLEKLTIEEFNTYFGAKRVKHSISSPSNWSIKDFSENFSDNDDFLEVCKFKWCFNIKPDIVIHTNNETTICIEAKYESNEGKYPTSTKDKLIFQNRFSKGKDNNNSYLIGQLSIQKYLMENVLDLNTSFVFLTKEKDGKYNSLTDILNLTWEEAFASLNLNSCTDFIKKSIEIITN